MIDVFQNVTDRIIAELENGLILWQKPWSGASGAISHVTGKPYSLLNQILLEGISGEYLTFEQAKKEGGSVRKGEKGKKIIFWKIVEKKEQENTNEEASDTVPLLRYYTVFHVSQCDGIAEKYGMSENAFTPSLSPDEIAEDK